MFQDLPPEEQLCHHHRGTILDFLNAEGYCVHCDPVAKGEKGCVVDSNCSITEAHVHMSATFITPTPMPKEDTWRSEAIRPPVTNKSSYPMYTMKLIEPDREKDEEFIKFVFAAGLLIGIVITDSVICLVNLFK